MARAHLLAAAVAVALLVLALGSARASEQDELRLREPPVARGLSFDFYKRSCPKAESIVHDFARDAVRKDVGSASSPASCASTSTTASSRAATRRCSWTGRPRRRGSTAPGEKQALPNLTLRTSAFKAINDLRDQLERECHGAVVSCSDILALAARDSVVATGGPEYRVPLGRRDSPWFATPRKVTDGLPRPSSNVHYLLKVFHNVSLDATDLVALSGGHTIGVGHCTSFEKRLYPRPDPTMNPSLVASLKRTCPAVGTDARTALDVGTPDVFDNKYFLNLLDREGLFVSDQDLFTNAITRPIVEGFARSQPDFFNQFGVSMVKMGQIKVLTGNQGQVRRNCAVRNPGTTDGLEWSSLMQTVDAAAESLGF